MDQPVSVYMQWLKISRGISFNGSGQTCHALLSVLLLIDWHFGAGRLLRYSLYKSRSEIFTSISGYDYYTARHKNTARHHIITHISRGAWLIGDLRYRQPLRTHNTRWSWHGIICWWLYDSRVYIFAKGWMPKLLKYVSFTLRETSKNPPPIQRPHAVAA